jgi:hypothetical protein
MRLSLLGTIALIAATFGGCIQAESTDTPTSGAPEVPDAAQPAGFDESSGGIEGTVFDEESAPMGGVQVAIQTADGVAGSTLSDVTGRFTFSSLAPGTYQVYASALGYESAAKAVQVQAGSVSPAQFVLIKITLIESYYETLPFKGFFDCTWSNPTGSGNCGYIGQTNGTTGNPLEPQWVNSKRKWNYESGPNVMSVLHDLTWTPGSFATGSKMSMTFSHGPLEDGTIRAGTHRYCWATGTNPVQLKWTRDAPDEVGECLTGSAQVGGSVPGPETIDPEGMTLQSFVSTGNGAIPVVNSDLPVGLAYQQPFEIYISIFHGEQAPDGFTAFADN